VALPEAKQTTAEQILLQGAADAQLVEMRARLLQNVPRAANPQLLLQDGPIIFTAHVETQDRREVLPVWRSGSLLKLTGVCSIQGGERHEPETFRLLIGKPGSIELLEAPPWWTSRQAFTAAGGMGVAIVAALAWVGLLRRQVRAQTKMILEISTREQRRIGHDLHDGVCQQLAGIAFMTSALADELEEQEVPQAAQADRISTMINEVIDHTRSVARGLFPIWLEENGLASALEELATNASEIFKINCRFLNERAPADVENSVALHLYYIALEAVANAAKHGRAQNIVIRLEPAAERYCLSIQDDGTGFSVGSPATTGMGLRIMNYRARVVGAVLQLESLPGSGTRVACLFLPESTKLARVAEQKLGNEQAVGRK
jgi:signal transduction histidine kinase